MRNLTNVKLQNEQNIAVTTYVDFVDKFKTLREAKFFILNSEMHDNDSFQNFIITYCFKVRNRNYVYITNYYSHLNQIDDFVKIDESFKNDDDFFEYVKSSKFLSKYIC